VTNPDEFVKALRGKTGRAAAKERENQNMSRMKFLLRQDRKTFLEGLAKYGLKPGDAAYEAALKFYDETE
jgi:hypothetical protein